LSIFLPLPLLINFTVAPSNLMLIALNGLEVIKKRNSYVNVLQTMSITEWLQRYSVAVNSMTGI